MEQMEIWKKRNAEKKLITEMVAIYCRAQKHGCAKGEVCDECASLLDYAIERIDKCPNMAEKTSCAECPTQCYKPDMRQQVRQVMRCAGPRMMLINPRMALKHAMSSRAKGKGAQTE